MNPKTLLLKLLFKHFPPEQWKKLIDMKDKGMINSTGQKIIINEWVKEVKKIYETS